MSVVPDRLRLTGSRSAFVSIVADHGRQPARPARVGQHLRGADLPVRRLGAGASSPSAWSTSSAGPSSRSRRRTRCRSRPRTVLEPIGILLLLKAFAGGSVALTGVEAIANGVPAFKPPESRNAANTMTAMAILLGVLFIGITIVRRAVRHPPDVAGRPVGHRHGRGDGVRRRARALLPVPGEHGADPVPRRQHELQRLPAARGDPGRRRLHAAPVLVPRRPARLLVGHRPAGGHRVGLLVAFGGDTHALIPLYSVGVFVCFTLSPGRHGPALAAASASPGWRWRAARQRLRRAS